MSSIPNSVPADLINMLRHLVAGEGNEALDCYERLTVTRPMATGTVCAMATAIAATVPSAGPGAVMSFDAGNTDGSPLAPWELAIGRVIACVGNDDMPTAVAVVDALTPEDVIRAGWDLAQMAAAVWADAARRDAEDGHR